MLTQPSIGAWGRAPQGSAERKAPEEQWEHGPEAPREAGHGLAAPGPHAPSHVLLLLLLAACPASRGPRNPSRSPSVRGTIRCVLVASWVLTSRPLPPSPASHLRSLWAPWAPRHRRGCWEKLGSSRCRRPGQNDPGLSLKGSVALSKGLDHSESPPYKGVRMPGGVTARMTSLPAHGAPRSVPGASSTRSSVFPWGPLPRH